MSVYTYFLLGIVLGIAISIVFVLNRNERFESKIELERKLFCTDKLDKMIEEVSNRISKRIEEKRDMLTETEKNEIIIQCCKEKFEI